MHVQESASTQKHISHLQHSHRVAKTSASVHRYSSSAHLQRASLTVSRVGLVTLDDNQGEYYSLGTSLPLYALPAATTLTLELPDATATYGSPLAASAVLLQGGAPLAGKEISTTAASAIIEAKWAELNKAYEDALRKKDKFAVPPREDELPQPAPLLVWTA